MAGEADIALFRSFVAPESAAAVAATLREGPLAAGPKIAEFEAALGRFLGNPNCVATCDRAAALTLALTRCGVGPGTEVLVSPLSCLATTMPILNLRAKPVWCDVDPATGMLAPDLLASRRTARTRAIVHYLWAGDVGPLAELRAFARASGLPLILDAAAAFGAEFEAARIGASADEYTVLSFYAVNPLNTGEGGALCSPSAAEAEALRWQRRFGIHQPSFRKPNGDLNPASDIPLMGYSFAMTNLTASLGLAQLAAVPAILARHRANGQFLDSALSSNPDLTLLERPAPGVSGYWVYALRTRRREALLARLHTHGIGAQRLHLRNDRYSCFEAAPYALPGVDTFDAENLALPCGWWVGDAERARITECLSNGW